MQSLECQERIVLHQSDFAGISASGRDRHSCRHGEFAGGRIISFIQGEGSSLWLKVLRLDGRIEFAEALTIPGGHFLLADYSADSQCFHGRILFNADLGEVAQLHAIGLEVCFEGFPAAVHGLLNNAREGLVGQPAEG